MLCWVNYQNLPWLKASVSEPTKCTHANELIYSGHYTCDAIANISQKGYCQWVGKRKNKTMTFIPFTKQFLKIAAKMNPCLICLQLFGNPNLWTRPATIWAFMKEKIWHCLKECISLSSIQSQSQSFKLGSSYVEKWYYHSHSDSIKKVKMCILKCFARSHVIC